MKTTISKLSIALLALSFVAYLSCSKDETPTVKEPIAKEEPKEETPTNNAPGAFELTGIANETSDVELLPTLSWQAATDADGDSVSYDLYFGTDAEPTLYKENLAETSFEITDDLDFGVTYYWVVKAKDGNGGVTESSAFSFTTKENTPPNTFALIGVTDGASGVDVYPTFTWEAATDVDGDEITYDLYLGKEENPETLYAENITDTTFEVAERLNLYENYYWKVLAKDGNDQISSVVNNFSTRALRLPNSAETFAAEFSARDGHTSVVFDNKIWVIGGYDDGSGNKNDVWYSTDGITWTEATSAAPFSARDKFTSVVFDNKIWVIGGYDGGYKNDVWYSTDGITWTEATSAAPFSARFFHTSVVFDDKIWVIGGYDGSYKNDVWYSADGITWTEATTAAPFSTRGGHTSVVFDDKIWVISSSKNDVWYSTDGITWTEATSAAPFSARFSHTSVVFDDKIWVIGGYDGSSKNDVWYSADGITWSEATSAAPFSARLGHTSVVFDEKFYVIGGYDGATKNDVWAFD